MFPKIKQAVDTVTADAEQLPAAAKSWGEELTSRYSAWTQFREGLEQYIQSATDLHTRVENEIDAQPIEVFVKDLDAFKKKLKVSFFDLFGTAFGVKPCNIHLSNALTNAYVNFGINFTTHILLLTLYLAAH